MAEASVKAFSWRNLMTASVQPGTPFKTAIKPEPKIRREMTKEKAPERRPREVLESTDGNRRLSIYSLST